MHNLKLPRFVLGAALVLAAGAAHADTAAAGRELLEKHKNAVVTVQMTIKLRFSFGGSSQEQEMQQEATGTVIDAETGLTVLSLSQVDPTSMIRSMMGGFMDDEGMDSDLVDLKILLDDGSEVPAGIVLRDQTFDLAFIRPTAKPETPMAAIDIADAGQPQILDELIVLNRLGRVANRAYSASVERVEAIVPRPRTYYIPGKDPTQSGLGCPAFTLDGKFVGILVLRTVSSAAGGGMGGMFGGDENIMGIIIPASDISQTLEQVPPVEEGA